MIEILVIMKDGRAWCGVKRMIYRKAFPEHVYPMAYENFVNGGEVEREIENPTKWEKWKHLNNENG